MENSHPEIESFEWKGQTRWKCPINWESGASCQYDTSDLDSLREHMRQPHQRKVERRTSAKLSEPPGPAFIPTPAPIHNDTPGQTFLEPDEKPEPDIKFRDE